MNKSISNENSKLVHIHSLSIKTKQNNQKNKKLFFLPAIPNNLIASFKKF